jgi:RES domain
MAAQDLGSCYFAERPEGCFLEVFKSFTEVIPRDELRSRLILKIELPRDMTVADCTSRQARAWGITAEIHSTPRYEETQAWANAFARAGFDGVYYFLRHDPAQRLSGVVLFGPAGLSPELPTSPGQPIDKAVIEEVRRRFGIDVGP